MKGKGKSQYYLVTSKKNGYTHGAFPFSPEGLEDAREYVKKSAAKGEPNLVIKLVGAGGQGVM